MMKADFERRQHSGRHSIGIAGQYDGSLAFVGVRPLWCHEF
jgi:hypothetical protein